MVFCRHITHISLIFLTCTLPALTAHAQTAEEVFNRYFKDWYQVELVIFERIDDTSRDPESWPKNIILSYPNNLTFFQSSDDDTESQDTATAIEADNNSEFLQRLKQGNPNDPLTRKLIDAIEKSELQRLTPREKPYVPLPADLRSLNDDARRLGRSRTMRVLFHEAWRQPFYNRESAPALVVTGGDAFGDHFELEGNVTLFLSRYLHIHTNLWLTQFEANFGQETAHWPLLPRRPELMQEITDVSAEEDLGTESTFDLQFDSTRRFNFGQPENNSGLFDDYTSLTQEPYVVRELLTMRQQRRMRSGELHYLDHPRLGLLIRIDRYQPAMP